MLRKKSVLIIGVIVALVLAGLVMWSASRNAAPAFLAGLSQNGYDDFVKAGNSLSILPTANKVPKDSVHTNPRMLEIFRAGLKKKFEAPAETYRMETMASRVMPNMALLKQLAQAVKAEGENLEDQGRFGEAAWIYVELIEYGQKVQAGPVIFCLVGLALEDMGLKALQGIETKLKDLERAQVVSRLEQLAAERISFEDVIKRERYFGRRNSLTPFHYLIALRMSRPAMDNARAKHDREVKAERDFIAKLKTDQ